MDANKWVPTMGCQTLFYSREITCKLFFQRPEITRWRDDKTTGQRVDETTTRRDDERVDESRQDDESTRSTAQHGLARCGTAPWCTVRHGTARTVRLRTVRLRTERHGVARHGAVRQNAARGGVVWHGAARNIIKYWNYHSSSRIGSMSMEITFLDTGFHSATF